MSFSLRQMCLTQLTLCRVPKALQDYILFQLYYTLESLIRLKNIIN